MFDNMEPGDQAFVLIVGLILLAVVIVKVTHAVANVRIARHESRGEPPADDRVGESPDGAV